jgi:hypothetical protein
MCLRLRLILWLITLLLMCRLCILLFGRIFRLVRLSRVLAGLAWVSLVWILGLSTIPVVLLAIRIISRVVLFPIVICILLLRIIAWVLLRLFDWVCLLASCLVRWPPRASSTGIFPISTSSAPTGSTSGSATLASFATALLISFVHLYIT